MTNNPRGLRMGLLAAGILLLGTAAAMASRNLWNQYRAGEQTSRLLELTEQRIAGEPLPEPGDAAQADPLAGYAVDGILSLPQLGLELPVLADYSDELLGVSVCLYEREPKTGRMVIAGHNYRVHFGRLGELEPGDTITYTALDGSRTGYQVTGLDTIAADDREGLEEGSWDLTLLTCTADLSDRLLVRLERAGEH